MVTMLTGDGSTLLYLLLGLGLVVFLGVKAIRKRTRKPDA
jgi:LPXTG-motif cell wall-anchored protein